jgi:hypothetical protein
VFAWSSRSLTPSPLLAPPSPTHERPQQGVNLVLDALTPQNGGSLLLCGRCVWCGGVPPWMTMMRFARDPCMQQRNNNDTHHHHMHDTNGQGLLAWLGIRSQIPWEIRFESTNHRKHETRTRSSLLALFYSFYLHFPPPPRS